MYRLGLILLALCLISLLGSQSAQAHVLFVDEKTKIAAVFHSNPDDDPIAGQITELYFDIQDQNSQVRIPYNAYFLSVKNEQNEETKVPIKAAGSTAIAEYNFPAQGLYALELKSKPAFDKFQKVSLSGSIRVNRGVGAVVNRDTNSWAVIGLITSVTSFVLILILFINNKRGALDNSRF